MLHLIDISDVIQTTKGFPKMPTNLRTAYIPSVHGFRFPNSFRNLVASTAVGDIATWGRCNGMSWISLDYFNAGRPAPVITNVDLSLPLHSGPAAAFDGAITQIFALRDSSIGDKPVGKTIGAGGISGWEVCANGLGHSAPAATCWGPGRTDLILRGLDNQIYHCGINGILANQREDFCTGGGLPGFAPLGEQTTFGPALATPYANRLEVYIVDTGGNLKFKYFEGTWHEWAALGRPGGLSITSGPAAVSKYGYMSAFVRGSDNGCWQRAWFNNGWQPWTSLGGIFTSGFAAASPAPGRVEVYGRGTDGGIWINIQENNNWNGWHPLGKPSVGLSPDSPAAISAWGMMDVYARGNDGNMWHCKWANGWQPWASVESVTDESRRLTNAIYDKTMACTVSPIIAEIAAIVGSGGLAALVLAALPPWKNYITWRTPSDEDCFHWSSTDELRKLISTLQRGIPIPLGLIAYNGYGHEVVAFGLTSPAEPTTDPLPGNSSWSIKVYDPNHPGCDNVTINIDPTSTRTTADGLHINKIQSSTGEMWRGCFVRDDYQRQTPPI